MRAAPKGAALFRWAKGYLFFLAAHSQCGQIALAGGMGQKVPCGVMRGKGKEMIVTAGLGTSLVQLRFNAPPDMWVLTFGRS